MRKVLLFALLLIFISLSSNIFAQVTVTLGEGTATNTTSGVPAPYGTWYKNFRQQYLVRATELNDVGGGPGNINSIAFNVDALNTCSPMPNFRIRIKETDQTALTTTFETGTYTQVFMENDFMPVVGWNTHTFSTPFDWDGASNLLIDVVTDLIPGGYTQNASAFYSPTNYNSSLRYQSDSSPADAATTGTTAMLRSNMQFNMEALDIDDMACTAIVGNTTPNVNSTASYAISVKNYSQTAVSNYTVKLMQEGDVEIGSVAGTSIDPQEVLSFNIDWTPTVTGETYLYGKVVMAGDENPANDESAPLTVTVMESGLLVASIGDGTDYNTTTGTPTPYGTFYKNFRQQYLYRADEFYAAGAAPGMIQSLAFNVQALNTCSPMPNFTIRLKHTDAEALTTTFETGDYTTVKTYTEYMPTAEWNLHNFDTPFMWDGSSNLIVEIVTDLIPGDWTQNASVYHTTTSYSSALRYQSDSSPASGGTTGTLASTHANIRFFMIVEGMGSLSGTVTAGGSPLAGASIEVEDTVFSAISGADGSYNIPYVGEGTQTVTATKHGYDEVSHTVTIVEDQNTVQDFALTLLPQVAVTGRIVGSDAITVGLADATITLTGYETYEATTDASGNFSIPDVFTGHTYNYTASAVGYSTTSGTVEVGASAVDMGDIVVNEVAYPASQVVATESDDYSYVTLEWQAPNPTAVDITEGFEGAEFPPADWSQIITDTGPANDLGVYPTWCQAGNIALAEPVPPNSGDYQAAMWWSYAHQDEWLITPEFTCPGGASFTFWSYVYYGSTNGDHYYIKVSTDGGNSWTALWDASAQTPEGQIAYDMPITIDLSDYAGQDIKVAFHAEDPPSNDGMWHVWFVDDVHIGSPTQRITFSSDQLTTRKDRPAMTRGTAQTLPISRDPNYITHNSARSQDRAHLGYHIYRLLAADQTNEANWEQLSPANGYAQTSMADNDWGPLPSGVYKYAVKALYTNDVLSTPAFSNELHKGMMGTLTGVVTEFGTDLPVEGATITAGEYSGTTDADGEYSFAVYAGNYTVTASKAGYQTETQTNVSITGLETTTLDFVITELTLPPAAVQAEEAGNNVNVTWMAPGTAGGEWITYAGDNNDSIGTGGAANFDVAIRFPPSALTEFAGMSLHALNLWPAQAGTFTAKVWTGGTASAPGTLVVEQPFTPVLDEYNTVVLDNPVMITGTEELWFGYNCNVTSGYPAGSDAGPAVDGFGNMMYFQEAWTTLTALNPDLNYNWNIEGYVGYGAPDRDSWIAIDAKTNFQEFNAERAMEGYKVWRLLQGQESNEAQWTTLTADPISATAYQDADWDSVPDGIYKWAVKAVYTGGALSNAAFSNSIERITEIGTVAGFVRDMDNQAISGATISTGNYSATSNAQGAYSMAIPAGTHTITASHPSYSAVAQSGVIVVTGQTTTVNFQLPEISIVFEDDFESYADFSLTFAPWTLVDVDQSPTYGFSGITFPNSGSAMAYIIFNPDATTPPLENHPPHSGTKMAASFAASTPTNNDWMITPQVPGGGEITFFARSYVPDYGLERFKVGVSTTGTAPADFAIISGANHVEAPVDWTEYNYSLADYAGQDIYVAIQCLSDDAFIFFVDDVSITGSVSIDDPVVPVYTTELKGNYPNPFNPTTTIRYSVRDNSPVTIDVFNVKGQRVSRLVNETKEAGEHTAVWNGKDDNGRAVSSGIYYFKMNAGKYSSTKKMIMMK